MSRMKATSDGESEVLSDTVFIASRGMVCHGVPYPLAYYMWLGPADNRMNHKEGVEMTEVVGRIERCMLRTVAHRSFTLYSSFYCYA